MKKIELGIWALLTQYGAYNPHNEIIGIFFTILFVTFITLFLLSKDI